MSQHPFQRLARKAEKLLGTHAPIAPLVAKIGRCTLVPSEQPFAALVRSVLAQLISTAAAKSITNKLMVTLKDELTPKAVLALEDDEFRASGVSRGKVKTLRGVAELFASRRGLEAELLAMDDAAVRDTLLPLHGIGPWTVDMFLIFVLGRPDVLPVGDLGVRAGAKDAFQMAELPTAAELTALAEPWRPYRTIASWYLWRSRGWVPQSE